MSAPAGNIGLLRCTLLNDGLRGVFPFSVIANLKGESIRHNGMIFLLYPVQPIGSGIPAIKNLKKA
jgi:hypothetical protein